MTNVLRRSQVEAPRSSAVDALVASREAVIAASGVLRYLLMRCGGRLPGGFGEVAQEWLQGRSGAEGGLAREFEELTQLAEEAERAADQRDGKNVAALGLLTHTLGCVATACQQQTEASTA
jgi:hypothetical protein